MVESVCFRCGVFVVFPLSSLADCFVHLGCCVRGYRCEFSSHFVLQLLYGEGVFDFARKLFNFFVIKNIAIDYCSCVSRSRFDPRGEYRNF